MGLVNGPRQKRLEQIGHTSYQRHLFELEHGEVEILERLEAERDPAYDVAAALAEVDQLQHEKNQRAIELQRERRRRAKVHA